MDRKRNLAAAGLDSELSSSTTRRRMVAQSNPLAATPSSSNASSSRLPPRTPSNAFSSTIPKTPSTGATTGLSSIYTQSTLERKLAMAQTSISNLDSKLTKKDQKIAELERDRRYLVEKSDEDRQTWQEEKRAWTDKESELESELKTLRHDVASLRESQYDLQDNQSQLSLDLSRVSAKLRERESQLRERNSQLFDKEAALEQKDEQIQKLESQLQELSTSASNSTLLNFTTDTAAASPDYKKAQDDDSIILNELHKQNAHLRQLESANSKLNSELTVLRARNTSIEVLREEKRALERKLAKVDELRERLIKAEQENERLKGAQRESAPTSTSVGSLTRTLSDLQLAHAELLSTHGETTASLRASEASLSQALSQISILESSLSEATSEIAKLKQRAAREESERRLLNREVKFLKGMLASYQSEDQDEVGVLRSGEEEERYRQMEELVEGYKRTIEILRAKLEADAPDPRDAKIEELSSGLEALQTSVQELEEHNEDLEQTLHELGGDIAAGQHIPPGMRVLEMKGNPAEIWAESCKEVIDRLKTENKALLDRLEELNSRVAPTASEATEGHDLVPRQTLDTALKEKEELEEKLKQKEKRLDRLTSIFQSKSAEFKDAITSILGVKLAFYPNGQVRVTSLFDLGASFVFQPTGAQDGNGGMQMSLIAHSPDGGPQDLQNMMEYWIGKEGCLPGFMASITLECWEAKKNGGGTS